MARLLLFSLFLLISFFVQAQQLAIGDWKLLLPYREVQSVSHATDKVFFASKYSLMTKDLTDGSLKFYDLVNGLSETDIRFIKYDKYSKSLFVVYENSNLDIISEEGTMNIPIIMNKQIVGNKLIYDIRFVGNEAYLSCGFGLVVLNTTTMEVSFSTFTDHPVKGAIVVDNNVYMATTDGIYTISLEQPNIQDFLNWTKLGAPDGMPNYSDFSYLGGLGNKLIFGASERLIRYDLDNHAVDTIFEGTNQELMKITQEGEGLVATFFCDGPGEWDECDGQIVYVNPDGEVSYIGTPDAFRPIDAVQDGDKLWIGDKWYPYRQVFLSGGHQDDITVNSPYSASAFSSKVMDDTLYVVAGKWSPTKSFPQLPSPDGLSSQSLSTGIWDVVNRTKPEYRFLQDSAADFNFMDIEINATNRKKYIATFGGGVLELSGEKTKVYNATNTVLRPEPGYTHRVGVIDMAFDKQENLWMTNYNTAKPLVVRKADGSWQNFSIGSGNTAVNRILIDDFGNKWVIIVSKGLLVFSEGEDLNAVGDDEYKLFNTNNSALTTNNVHAMAQDLDGSIWVGTDEGVVTFECGGDVFGDFCYGSRRIATLDDIPAYLLKDEKVTAVAVDGANRKWFGTTNGVFVLSPSGEEVIHNFNVSNSPLPNNDIQSISIDNATGTVYIGTSFGLASYRSDAVKGRFLHEQDVYAYPNPVRPEYTGPIAIKGLAQNANVKITDAAGRLVYETEALGGQAVWDGRDYNHNKVVSGVYLVFTTSQPGLTVDAMVTKIVVIH